MSASPQSSTKAAASADGDHRKRRRNRTTQSCLNCHTTKRMCDRKRPACSRCSQLGVSGNCVYEIDDLKRAANKTKEDEGARLMNRIAELEGFIRELKRKPSPTGSRSPSVSSGEPSTSRLSMPPGSPRRSSPSHSPGPLFPSGMDNYRSVDVHSRASESLASLMAACANLTDHMFLQRGGGTCSCLNETSCYNAVLRLSLILRNAADVLSQSHSHSSRSGCALNDQISELDNFIKTSLLHVPSSDFSMPLNFNHESGSPTLPYPSSPTFFTPSYTENNGLYWNLGDESDNFMSWVPAARNS
ncbi:hypothetical protein R3P38DRAFT_3533190 [Favolaschia claudopus]|uniref:Zn(2)-C6 fungal-type domain-containing protein n=1 Tax=Favolaschia claudopus TaxID=2862362 RepID=A0AAW0BGR5_9AGAR